MSRYGNDFKEFQKQQKLAIKNAHVEVANAIKEVIFLFNQKIINSTTSTVCIIYDPLIQANLNKIAKALSQMNLTSCEVYHKKIPQSTQPKSIGFNVPIVPDSQETQEDDDEQEASSPKDKE